MPLPLFPLTVLLASVSDPGPTTTMPAPGVQIFPFTIVCPPLIVVCLRVRLPVRSTCKMRKAGAVESRLIVAPLPSIVMALVIRCSLANTLRFQRLKFSRKKLMKGPNMVGQARCHGGRARPPSGTNRPPGGTLVQRQRLPQAHVRSPHIVEGLEEDHPLPQALAVFTKAGCLARQGSQGLPHRQVHPFDQGRADRVAQARQAFGPKHDARTERQQFALRLLFDQLSIDQIRMGLTDRLAWATPLAGSCTRRHDGEDSKKRGQIACKSIA